MHENAKKTGLAGRFPLSECPTISVTTGACICNLQFSTLPSPTPNEHVSDVRYDDVGALLVSCSSGGCVAISSW